MRYMVRPVERRAIERTDAAKRKKRFASNYAEFNTLLPMSPQARSEREKSRKLLLALFANESEESRREREGMRLLAAALGIELKPRAPRLRW